MLEERSRRPAVNLLVPDIGNDNSLGGGLIGATTILLVNGAVAYVTFRFKRADRVIEHSPTLLVRNGRVLRATPSSRRTDA